MKKVIGLCICFFVQLAAFNADDSLSSEFVLKVAKAQVITETEQGALYDSELGNYFMSLSETEQGLSNCLENNPGPQWVVGFFEFKKSGEYSLQLEPISTFSKCLEKVFADKNPPKPPRLPYLNSFSFEFDG